MIFACLLVCLCVRACCVLRVGYGLFVVSCLLFDVCNVSRVVRCVLFVVRCLMFVV